MTVVRDAVDLGYPLAVSVASYLPICDEVVIAYDPGSRDGTADLVCDLARAEPAIRPLASSWSPDNRTAGAEIRVQSQHAADAASGDWILYVQADEAIHEDDHRAIRAALQDRRLAAALFDRRMFRDTLDREIPQYRNCGLLRLFRAGRARVAGDAVTCELVPGERREVLDAGWRMFDYGRVGATAAVLHRKRVLNALYHEDRVLDASLASEYWQTLRRFDRARHPAVVRASALAEPALPLVTLAILLGAGERSLLPEFAGQFDPWGGDIVIIDDSGGDGGLEALCDALRPAVDGDRARIIVRARPPGCVNAVARNLAHELAAGAWVLHVDVDERLDPAFVGRIAGFVHQLRAQQTTVCGLPRANFLDGLLANDVPPPQWTEALLPHAAGSWPPRHEDVQYRLLAREERWGGAIHERPLGAAAGPPRAMQLDGAWIVHDKTLQRQRRQDAHYRSQGQHASMPAPVRRPRRAAAQPADHAGPASALAVARSEAPAPTGPYRFLFVDGAGPSDGVMLALDAYRQAFRHDDDVELLVVDDSGRLAATIGSLQASRHGAPIVRCTSASAGPELYRACDCLLATYDETDHGAIAAAMSAGLDVIAPDRGPWLNYCDPRTAFLFPAVGRDALGVLRALLHHVVADPERGRAIGRLAAARMQDRARAVRGSEPGP